jgi:hypothetical protein
MSSARWTDASRLYFMTRQLGESDNSFEVESRVNVYTFGEGGMTTASFRWIIDWHAFADHVLHVDIHPLMGASLVFLPRNKVFLVYYFDV